MRITRLAMKSKRDETCDNNCGDTSIVPREQKAMVRRTIASMVRKTIANVVYQEQEDHDNRLGQLETKQFGKLYNMNNQKRLEARTILLEIASQVTRIAQNSSNGKGKKNPGRPRKIQLIDSRPRGPEEVDI